MMNLDIAIVVGFLIVTLVVGLGHGKGIKNIKDYALGGRNFSTGALVATLVATWIGGSAFFIDLSKTYSDGLSYIIPVYGEALSFIIMAYIFVPRMGEFLGKISIAEAMDGLYGNKVRLIVAITGTIGAMGGIAVQFKVFGSIVSYFLNFSAFEGIVISAFIVTLYSAFGGIRAVTFTDILQLFTFGFAIPILGVMIWNHAYYEGFSFANSMQDPKFNFEIVFSKENPELLSIIALMLYFALPGMKPAIFQRISMGSNIKQVQKAFIIASGLIVFITLASQWIPFLLFNINSHLEYDQLFGYIIENYTYIGLKGLMIAGIMAMTMSTADSHINASAVLFAHDICRPLNIGKSKELLISKIFALFLGIGGIILAVSARDLLDVVLTANSFYIPVVTIPVMLTILGFRSSTKSVLIGMTAGFTTVIIWKLLAINADCIVFAMLINLIFLMGSHYLLKQRGGWVGIKDKASLKAMREEKLREQEERVRKADDFNFIDFCKKHFPSNELSYTGLGVYLIIYTITTMYSTQIELLKDNSRMILVIYQIMLVSGVLLLMYPIWPRSIDQNKKETIAQILWPVVIFYMLVLFNSFFVMVSDFSTLQFAVFTVNLLITSILLGWRLGGIMIFIGICFGISLYQSYNPEYRFDTSIGSPAFIMVYIFMLIGAIIVIFLKPKQEHLEATEQKVGILETEVIHYNERISDQEKEIHRLGATAQKILNNVNHELRLPIGNVVNFAEMLNEGLEKYSKDQLKELSDEVLKNSTRLSSMILNMLDLATLSARTIELQKKTVNLSELVEERVKTCRNIYLQKKKIDFELSIAQNLFIDVDPNYIRQTVDNLVINAITFSEKGVIKISVTKQQNVAVFVITNEGEPIPHTELYDIFTAFRMASNTESQAEGRGVGLALCKAAIEAHGGMIKAENTGKGAKFRFVLPL